jgi:galactonate dehydratase
MYITAIEPALVHVNHRGDWVFVQVHTDAGLTGTGEASHSGNDALLVAVFAQYEQRLLGEDPTRIGAIRAWASKGELGRVRRTAWSGLEQALWDLLGQSLGVPIHVLFGGAVRDRIRLYANINRHVSERTPDGFAVAAREAVDEGFAAIKLAPFDEVSGASRVRTGLRAAWQQGVARVRAVRQAIGPGVELMVDCHGRFEAAEALRVAEALAGLDLLWLEEPVPDTQLEALSQLTAVLPVATASGESVYGIEGFAPFLSRRIVDVLMPDVKHDGGLLDTRIVAEAARMNGLLVAPHNPSGPVATAATAQVICTLPDAMLLEYAWGEVDWRASLMEPPERIERGFLVVPEGHGLGHRLAPEALEAHRQTSPSHTDSSKVRST